MLIIIIKRFGGIDSMYQLMTTDILILTVKQQSSDNRGRERVLGEKEEAKLELTLTVEEGLGHFSGGGGAITGHQNHKLKTVCINHNKFKK